MSPERLQETVRARHAHVGIAVDGDADRAVFVTERGDVISGDHALAAFALDLQRQKKLNHRTVVGTVMSNFGFELAMKKAGINVIRTPVGDRHVLRRMLTDGYNLGGEPSGHIVFLDHHTTGDGLIAGLQLLTLIKRSGLPVSEMTRCMDAVPQVLVDVPVKRTPDLQSVPEVRHVMRSCEERLNGTGRMLVRYSGTEPLVRVMVEGSDDLRIRDLADDIAGVLKTTLG